MYYTNEKYQRLSNDYLMGSRRKQPARDVARYTPSMARLYDAGRSGDQRDAVVIRYVADDYAGGFWKQTGGRVEFIGLETPTGQRLVVVLDTLGVGLPGGWR